MKSKGLRFKISLLFLAISVLPISLLAGIMLFRTQNLLYGQMTARSIDVARTTASKVDSIRFNQIQSKEDMSSDYYNSLLLEVKSIRDISGSQYLYLIRRTNEGKFVNVIDADHGVDGQEIITGVEIDYYTPEMDVVYNSGEPYVSNNVEISEYGTIIYSYYPIKDRSGRVIGLIGVDYDVEAAYNALLGFKKFLFITVIALIITVLIIGLWTSKIIFKPMDKLVEISEEISNFKIAHEIPVELRNRKDEIGQLCNSFQHMIERLRFFIKDVAQSAEQVAVFSTEMSQISNQVVQATEHIAVSSSDVASNAKDQIDGVKSTVLSLSKTSAKIEELSQNANSIAGISNKVLVKSNKGKEEMFRVDTQMRYIEESTGNVQGSLVEITESSNKMNEIINVIKNIAEQTNLLALNAAIEAARAGDHGKGFAVVAEEVRTLAEDSEKAADEISKLIILNKNNIDGANLTMKKGLESVSDGTKVVSSAMKSFEEIRALIEEVDTQIKSIIENINLIEEGSKEVTGLANTINEKSENVSIQIESISAATEEQVASMQEIASSSETLKEQARILKEALSKFEVM